MNKTLHDALLELQIVAHIYAIPNKGQVMEFITLLCMGELDQAKTLWQGGVSQVFEKTEIDYLYIQEIDDYLEGKL